MVWSSLSLRSFRIEKKAPEVSLNLQVLSAEADLESCVEAVKKSRDAGLVNMLCSFLEPKMRVKPQQEA